MDKPNDLNKLPFQLKQLTSSISRVSEGGTSSGSRPSPAEIEVFLGNTTSDQTPGSNRLRYQPMALSSFTCSQSLPQAAMVCRCLQCGRNKACPPMQASRVRRANNQIQLQPVIDVADGPNKKATKSATSFTVMNLFTR